MPTRTTVLPSFYQDSVVLMRIAGQVRSRPGVRQTAAFMGTPANHALLEETGLATPESRNAHAEDLILTVDADTDPEAEAALAEARQLLFARRHVVETATALRPRTLDSALKVLPNANLVVISVPGAYAKFEAMRALKRGLHVFLFSDNVPVQDEIELKQEAVKRRLVCMGPDCGTAYLNGTGIGFYNVVPRGRIGIVAASGTGLQAVASRLATQGEGVSHGIGVGGRDLSAEVGGAMSLFALESLAGDPTTEAIILISKPPHPTVLPRLEAAMARTGKPVVACVLGANPPPGSAALWVETLDDAADAMVARLAHRAWTPAAFADPIFVRARLQALGSPRPAIGPGVLGLYTGGTLAHEAHLLLTRLLGDSRPHRVLDLGDDRYTVGRPHPMIDPAPRSELIVKAGDAPETGVLLVDLVLGRGAHPNPASLLAEAVREAQNRARAAGRCLAAVGSIVGTAQDPQGLAAQRTQLEAAGIEVFPSNAEATRFAALLIRPELSGLLPEGAS